MITLYEIATRSDIRPSPFCWRIRMALRHQGLPFKTEATTYAGIRTLGHGEFKSVPVIEDDGQWFGGSMNIAKHLEAKHPGAHSLFPNDPKHLFAEFVERWAEHVLHGAIFPMVAWLVWKDLPESEQDYFRRTRELRLKRTLEEAFERSPALVPVLRSNLEPLRHTLAEREYLAGEFPAFADYLVYGALKWHWLMTGTSLLEDGDPVQAWYRRVDAVKA